MTTNTNTATSARTSTLARLLATENLRIAHDASLPTAAFDGSTRTLYLPQWRVDKQTYDMLVGHEVAHAKYTDFPQWEAARNRIAKSKVQAAVINDFINVVEDARIERLIKRDYPGLRPDFKHGYATLHDKMDIFKKKGKTITVEDRFIDRINLHYKVGIHCGMTIPFTDEERTVLDRINALSDGKNDFAKVVAIAEELYEREKAEMQEQQQQEGEGEGESKKSKKGKDESKKSKKGKGKGKPQKGQKADDADDADDDGEEDASSPQDGEDEDESEDGSEGDQDGSEGDEGEGEDGEGEEGEDGSEGDQDGSEGDQDGSEEGEGDEEGDEYTPQMVQSADNGRSGLSRLVDCSVVEQQIELRPIDASKVTVTTEEFVKMVDETTKVWNRKGYNNVEVTDQSEKIRLLDEDAAKLFKKISDDNRKSVELMCRRFEIRRSARNQARTTSQKTGRLSTRLLSKYRFSEDIFDRMTVRNDEQNHGIVIMLDWSGSMSGIIKESISQLVATVLFCRRVGIPVEVYFFTSTFSKPVKEGIRKMIPGIKDAEIETMLSYGAATVGGKTVYLNGKQQYEMFNAAATGSKPGEIAEGKASSYHPFSLVKVYDSGCSTKRMTATLGRLAIIGHLASGSYVDINHNRCHSLGEALRLGGTPLDESIIAMRDIVNNFRKSSNTKITLISMTDGEGGSIISQTGSIKVDGKKKIARVLVDSTNGVRYSLENDYDIETHSVAVDMFKRGTGARIVGVRLEMMDASNMTRNLSSYSSMYAKSMQSRKIKHDSPIVTKETEDFKRNSFLALEIDGYDGYCLVNMPARDHAATKVAASETKARQMKTDGNRRKHLEAAFIASMRGKQANRVFINALMDVVAK